MSRNLVAGPRIDERKSKLAKLLKGGRHSGIALNEHLEADAARAFAHACLLGFEGIVSKRRDSRYVSGRSETWIKVKNPNAPGVLRFRDHDAQIAVAAVAPVGAVGAFSAKRA